MERSMELEFSIRIMGLNVESSGRMGFNKVGQGAKNKASKIK